MRKTQNITAYVEIPPYSYIHNIARGRIDCLALNRTPISCLQDVMLPQFVLSVHNEFAWDLHKPQK